MGILRCSRHDPASVLGSKLGSRNGENPCAARAFFRFNGLGGRPGGTRTLHVPNKINGLGCALERCNAPILERNLSHFSPDHRLLVYLRARKAGSLNDGSLVVDSQRLLLPSNEELMATLTPARSAPCRRYMPIWARAIAGHGGGCGDRMRGRRVGSGLEEGCGR